MTNGFNGTNFSGALKKRYARDFVESMAYKNSPFLGLISKMEDMGGASWEQPVLFEDPQSRSADFAQAQTLSTTSYSRVKVFSVTRIEDFGLVTVKGQDIKASKGHEGAFFNMVTAAIDGIMRATSRSASTSLFRKGWGAIGRVSSPGADTTMTLVDRQDIVNIAVGQELVFSSSEDAATLRNSGGSLVVAGGVDRNAGTFTVSANETTVTGISDGDYIFIKGDRQDSATPTRRKIAGIEDWCPQTVPTSTAFFGVDRTVDTRLGGCRLDATSPALPLEEALIEGMARVQVEGGQIDHFVMNPTKFADLTKALGARCSYVNLKATAQIGYPGAEVNLNGGNVKIFADRDCPVNRVFGLQLDTWKLGSLGMIPQILNHDGLESMRQANDDGIEIRVGYYGNMFCMAPGWNINIKV